ncbi:protein FAM228B-like [Bombina bombina]|uniref:protein FAM228B-like n=1 Tax=Bombina bombina TaxID=8345 RepID=UPI00235A4821|nr:protein FAM228B-like [Bombina bombina]
MAPSFSSHMKEGVITLQTEQLPKDLLPDKGQSQEVKIWKLPKKCDYLFLPTQTVQSSFVSRKLPSTCLRKAEDWLAQKPYVQLADENDQDISAMAKHVLDTQNHYNQIIDNYLKQTDILELRRKEVQHKKWTERVSLPLQKTLENYINIQSSEDIERRRRVVLAQYLKYCNRKGSAFMKDFDPSEYNPYKLQLDKHYLQVSTPPLVDPLLQQVQKRFEEECVALQCETGRQYSAKEIREKKLPRFPLGRQSIDGAKWVKCHFGYIESEARQKHRQKMKGKSNQESFNFRAWGEDTDTWNLNNLKLRKRTHSPTVFSKEPDSSQTVQIITI